MKKLSIIALAICCATALCAKKPNKAAEQVVDKTTNTESVVLQPQNMLQEISYALGAQIGDTYSKNAVQTGIEIDWDWLKQGITEATNGKNRFDEAKMRAAFAQLDSLFGENQKVKSHEQKEFLTKNKVEKDVITTLSGLQYKVVRLGTGAKPLATDKVKVNYEGKTIDGSVFDSSYQRGEPISFPLNGVISGWTEGLQLMPVGSEFIFYIPSELGYGDQGAGGAIAPGATLIFRIELLDINPVE
ncbi:MAG: FKBP-type peptidyl-prolyl cis-trans isomerase [Prevotellaceae bacterium]|jgi:FKBP-type peptidyl-prolyl cis-trans isomerase|nr:FKBP-type peptidyl-prolyl cis-trans isomerase [Prevotellaceae bacterium]